MRESELLAAIAQRSRDLASPSGPILVGPGDDCAVIAAPSGSRWLAKVDQVIERRHFEPGTPADLVARKAIARTISDIAAAGGTPAWSLVAVAIPPAFSAAEDLVAALDRWARHWRCPIAGGDIAAQSNRADPLQIVVTVIGQPHPTRGPVLRSGARPGDVLCTTGRIGGSLRSGRHLAIEPRLAEAHWLCDSLASGLHAMIDLSDGLGRDAARLAEASAAAAEIDAARIPLHPDAAPVLQAVGDGEDYELLCAVDPAFAVDLFRHGSAACPGTGTPLTPIGRIVPRAASAPAAVLVQPDGTSHDISALGWDHTA